MVDDICYDKVHSVPHAHIGLQLESRQWRWSPAVLRIHSSSFCPGSGSDLSEISWSKMLLHIFLTLNHQHTSKFWYLITSKLLIYFTCSTFFSSSLYLICFETLRSSQLKTCNRIQIKNGFRIWIRFRPMASGFLTPVGRRVL